MEVGEHHERIYSNNDYFVNYIIISRFCNNDYRYINRND